MRAQDEETTASQADGTVDRLLAGLRENTPADLEARLLDRLEEAARRGRAPHRWLLARSHVAFFGAATAVAGLVLAVALSQRKPTATPVIAGQPPLHGPTLQDVARESHQDRRMVSAQAEGPRRREIHPSAMEAPAKQTVASAADAREQAMWDDFRAPTQVAPPIPLTPEERKMHRLIRDARAPQVASLDPILQEIETDRADQDHERRAADYEQFFRPSAPPADAETDSSDLKGTQP